MSDCGRSENVFSTRKKTLAGWAGLHAGVVVVGGGPGICSAVTIFGFDIHDLRDVCDVCTFVCLWLWFLCVFVFVVVVVCVHVVLCHVV